METDAARARETTAGAVVGVCKQSLQSAAVRRCLQEREDRRLRRPAPVGQEFWRLLQNSAGNW